MKRKLWHGEAAGGRNYAAARTRSFGEEVT